MLRRAILICAAISCFGGAALAAEVTYVLETPGVV